MYYTVHIIKMKDYNKKIILSLIITIALGYFLLSQTDYKNIFSLFKEVNYLYIIISFIFYFLTTYLRSIRIKMLIKNKTNSNNLVATVLVNSLIVNILPFRIGELSLPLLLKKYSGISKREGFLLLFYLRAIDTIIIIFFFLVAILLFSNNFINLGAISHILIFLLLLIMFLIILKTDSILSLIKYHSDKQKSINFFNRLSLHIDSLLPIYKFYKNKIKKTFVLSILIFITLIFVLSFTLKAYPMAISNIDIISASLIVILITSLPINGIAGIGIFELGVSFFLISKGIDKNLSINISFNYHFIYLLFIIFFGSLSFLYLHNKK